MSSTKVRKLFKEQNYTELAKICHPQVLEYIKKHGLIGQGETQTQIIQTEVGIKKEF